MAKEIRAEALEYLPMDQGNLRGFFTIKIGPCEFRKVRLVQQPGQAPFASPPQESYLKDGQRRYVTLVKWPSEWNKPILEALLEAQRNHPEGILRISDAATPLGREVQARAGIGGGH